MPDSVVTLADEILKRLKLLTYATIGLFVVLALVFGFLLLRINSIAESNTEALCAFRHDKEQGVEQAEAYLKNHPEGFEDFSAEDIRQNIADEKQDIESLSALDCPPSTF